MSGKYHSKYWVERGEHDKLLEENKKLKQQITSLRGELEQADKCIKNREKSCYQWQDDYRNLESERDKLRGELEEHAYNFAKKEVCLKSDLLQAAQMLRKDLAEIQALKEKLKEARVIENRAVLELQRHMKGCKTAWCDPIREVQAENAKLKSALEKVGILFESPLFEEVLSAEQDNKLCELVAEIQSLNPKEPKEGVCETCSGTGFYEDIRPCLDCKPEGHDPTGGE